MKYRISILKTVLIALIGLLNCSALLMCADPVPEKNMTIIIPSYNNALWYKQNLNSVLSQHYSNLNVIYIDDCSPDNTGDLVEEYIKNYDTNNRITVIKNSTRRGAMANIYNAVHSCPDNTIILTLDGDDWFAHDNVLKIVNNYYQDPDVWMTYGQYQVCPGDSIGHCQDIPQDIIKNNAYRDYPWVTSHLRTFYARLFKAIKKEDLYYNNDFAPMAWDIAFMYPMLEMCGGRFKFIPEILYIYNRLNQINDDKINRPLQLSINIYLLKKQRYTSLKPILAN
ncbi:MAG: glycosyltransferase family 2 protein [Candidatus Dependentiae bacterium]|nr:glycosyltransferase family 2 protein [Candidatus Dependentiae bacterium]